MERALSVLRLYRRSSGNSPGGACTGQCGFIEDGGVLFCDVHDRFIDPHKHEKLQECSLDACDFVIERERGQLVCPVSGRQFDYEISDESKYKYEWCTGFENQIADGERGEGGEEEEEEEEMGREGDGKRKQQLEGEEDTKKKRSKQVKEDEAQGEGEEDEDEAGKRNRKRKDKSIPTSRKDESSGRAQEIVRHIRESMLETVNSVVDFITVNVPAEKKEAMVHGACHAFCVMNGLRPSANVFPLRTFAALFLRICLDQTQVIHGGFRVDGVTFPVNFTNLATWHGAIGEPKTRALTRKQKLLRDLFRAHPEIVQIKNYQPFIVPYHVLKWGKDLLKYKI